MTGRRLLVIPGSLRRASRNLRLAQDLVDAAPEGVTAYLYEGVGDLPLYNEDLDHRDPPPTVARLRSAILAADAVVIVTPEHNATMSAAVKNLIDWASGPYGSSSLSGRPVAVFGTSRGAAQADARRALAKAGACPLPPPHQDGTAADGHAARAQLRLVLDAAVRTP